MCEIVFNIRLCLFTCWMCLSEAPTCILHATGKHQQVKKSTQRREMFSFHHFDCRGKQPTTAQRLSYNTSDKSCSNVSSYVRGSTVGGAGPETTAGDSSECYRRQTQTWGVQVNIHRSESDMFRRWSGRRKWTASPAMLHRRKRLWQAKHWLSAHHETIQMYCVILHSFSSFTFTYYFKSDTPTPQFFLFPVVIEMYH